MLGYITIGLSTIILKKTGLWLEYYKTGTTKIKSHYDKFGNLLQKSIYTLQGHTSSHLTAVSIDSELTNYTTYFIRNEEVLITFSVSNYKFGLDTGKVYLREKGLLKGGRRIGVWSLYTQRGSLEKAINYNNK